MTDPRVAPPGWYFDGRDSRRRYWDGSQWSDQYEQPNLSQPAPDESKSARVGFLKRNKGPKLPSEQRTAILEAEIAKWARSGWRLESTLFGTKASMRKSRARVVGVDLLLLLLTCGLWLIYIIYRSLIGRTASRIITVDRYGRVKTFIYRDDTLSGG